eukprot:CAMPEP_0119049986 /NCGR_PEP_ID=MMETSP1177-20130426/67642_1 /TAXON_ID=2985 /ORGANISM="Ochromonas sp, Strain CCMP1899" /LENGTH=209 /DNA_ID=CAMNT_0007027865 /DNA_START=505 /DNA_END=1131 /DNA_ORIENTATION=-
MANFGDDDNDAASFGDYIDENTFFSYDSCDQKTRGMRHLTKHRSLDDQELPLSPREDFVTALPKIEEYYIELFRLNENETLCYRSPHMLRINTASTQSFDPHAPPSYANTPSAMGIPWCPVSPPSGKEPFTGGFERTGSPRSMRKVVDYGQFMQTQREERSLAEAIQKSEEKNKIAETIDNTTVDFLSDMIESPEEEPLPVLQTDPDPP